LIGLSHGYNSTGLRIYFSPQIDFEGATPVLRHNY
jgi:hypothetical protein